MKRFSILFSFLIFFGASCLASVLNITTQEKAFFNLTVSMLIFVGILLIISTIIILDKNKTSLKKIINENKKSIIQELVLVIALIIIFSTIVRFTSVNNLIAYEITWFIASIIYTILKCKRVESES